MDGVLVSYNHIRQALKVNGEILYQVNDVSEGVRLTSQVSDLCLRYDIGVSQI
jgi:hypothetical protein